MQELLALWLPILVATAATWIASALAWTVLPHHKKEFKALPDEGAFDQTVGGLKLEPGVYMFPYCDDAKQMKEPSFQERLKAGPVGMLCIWPGMANMGLAMALTALFFLVTSTVIAYLLTQAFEAGAPALDIFQMAGTAGLLAFCFATIPNDIWFQRPRRWVLTNFLDGLAYALILAGIFAWLWPGAPEPPAIAPGG